MTVPPQALGISPAPPIVVDSPPAGGKIIPAVVVGGTEPLAANKNPAAAVPIAAAVAVPPPQPSPAPPAISSRTMEQLAEFDSILESKFQFNNISSSSLLLPGSGSGGNSLTIIKSEEVGVEPALLPGLDSQSLR